MYDVPDLKAIQQAAERISGHVHKTPVMTCKTIDNLLDGNLFFKCENFQKVGAFKFRGACNAVMRLDEQTASRGVATHSSGNHAQAVALAAKTRGIPAHIVMPRTSPAVKLAAVKDYGAAITLCEPTLQARESTLEKVVAETGAEFIHPYNDYRVIAGQATTAMELLNDYPQIDTLIAPVGGGGLLSGTALTAHYLRPEAVVLAGEPEGADDAYRSLVSGERQPAGDHQTIADGLLTALGDKTFPIIRDHVKKILLVNDQQIVAAMRLIWERMKLVVEPSAAVPLAALLANPRMSRHRKIGVILTGGNVDLGHLPWS